ncbi:MAG TPA: hypothetical protein VGA70_03790 [Longimicrobiales bacterium]|jgi:hypothetical protein
MGIEVGENAVEMVIGLFAWFIANWVYLDFRRTGRRGFKRLVGFWMGWPGTFLSMLLVRDGSQPAMLGDDTGLDQLMNQIRRDRRLRAGDERPSPDPPDGEHEAGPGDPAG